MSSAAYLTSGSTHESVVESVEKNKELYEWAPTTDNYPPHVKTIPKKDDKSQLQIFNLLALLQTLGMVKPENLSEQYTRLAPPSDITSLDALIKYNEIQRAPPGVNNNMLFPLNIGDRKDGRWYTDAVFAQQHFTGTNATTITRAKSDTKDWIASFKESAEAAQNEDMLKILNDSDARLYVQDYSYFRSDMGLSDDKPLASGTGRYGVAPVALFQLGKDGRLHPLAIVIDYKGSMAASVVIFNKRLTPGSGSPAEQDEEEKDWPWRYAKTCVQCADWLRHEVSIHLVNTHLVEEASIVAAHRTLPPSHIVYQLLYQHWDTTLPLNKQAREVLVPAVITQIAPVGSGELVKFLNNAYLAFDWKGLYIPNDLEARGFPLDELDDPQFHNYAYARNMKCMWNTIRSFVAEVLNHCYANDDQVKNDKYIQRFCTEMRSSQAAHVSTFPEIETLKGLIDAVTMSIHIASPQHTAVNYLQQYYQVFVPNKPWALYQPPPSTLAELQGYQEEHLIAALPFKKEAQRDWLRGAQLPYLLSFEVISESSLLTYADNQLSNKIEIIAKAAQEFKNKLIGLQETFKQHSKALDDKETVYSVMDPAITAVSILI